jgi:hypothetical protein
MTARKPSFESFIARIKGGNPAVEAFMAYVAEEGCPDGATWGEIRLDIRKAGADYLAVVGARLAWRAFKEQ